MTGNPVTVTQAVDAAGAVYARLCAQQERLAATGGPEAVAAVACPGGSPEQQARVAGLFARLQDPSAGQPAA